MYVPTGSSKESPAQLVNSDTTSLFELLTVMTLLIIVSVLTSLIFLSAARCSQAMSVVILLTDSWCPSGKSTGSSVMVNVPDELHASASVRMVESVAAFIPLAES